MLPLDLAVERQALVEAMAEEQHEALEVRLVAAAVVAILVVGDFAVAADAGIARLLGGRRWRRRCRHGLSLLVGERVGLRLELLQLFGLRFDLLLELRDQGLEFGLVGKGRAGGKDAGAKDSESQSFHERLRRKNRGRAARRRRRRTFRGDPPGRRAAMLGRAIGTKGGAETRRSLGLAKPGATAAAGLGDAAAARSPTSAAAGSSAGLRPGRLQARSSMPALSCASVEETGWLFPRREGLAVAYRGRRGKPGGFLSENHRDHSSREDQFAARGDPQSILATTVVDQQFTAAVQQRRARNPQWAGVVARRRSAIGI